mmetsp:Transcript_32605/g.50986  ORF Transcript_32605/g.50986 Transcript_32605/m.50986 type:complete len:81 (-) Transcript_32605:661-903(-)
MKITQRANESELTERMPNRNKKNERKITHRINTPTNKKNAQQKTQKNSQKEHTLEANKKKTSISLFATSSNLSFSSLLLT